MRYLQLQTIKFCINRVLPLEPLHFQHVYLEELRAVLGLCPILHQLKGTTLLLLFDGQPLLLPSSVRRKGHKFLDFVGLGHL